VDRVVLVRDLPSAAMARRRPDSTKHSAFPEAEMQKTNASPASGRHWSRIVKVGVFSETSGKALVLHFRS
jgi:hypothetical protein